MRRDPDHKVLPLALLAVAVVLLWSCGARRPVAKVERPPRPVARPAEPRRPVETTPAPLPAPPQPVAPGPDEEQSRIARAFSRREYRAVVEEFAKLEKRYPAHLKGADDLYYLGYASFVLADDGPALKSLLEFQFRFPNDPRTPEVFYLLAKIYRRLGQREKALDFLRQAVQLTPERSLRRKAWEEKADIFAEEGLYLESLSVLDEAYAAAGASERLRLLRKIERILSKMPVELLAESVIPGAYRFPKDEARRLYARAVKRDETLRTERPWWFPPPAPSPREEKQAPPPQTPEAVPAEARPTRTIGVLIPASGKLAAYGLQVRRGIEFALEEEAGANYPYRIEVVYRDEESVDEFAPAVRDMVDHDDILVLLGPLLSSTVERVLPAAEELSLAVFSPTASAERLEGISPNFFRNCLTLRELAAALAGFATGTLELGRFAVLAPDEAYGHRFAALFAGEVGNRGGEIVASLDYDPALTDFAKPIRSLKAATGIPQSASAGHPLPFDALFLPGYAEQIGMIIPQLVFHDIDVDRLTILGGSGLNTPRFPEVGEKLAEGVIFADGFFAGSSEVEVQRFVDRYREKFKAAPETFTAQSYAAVAIILDLIRRGVSTRGQMLDLLGEVSEFPGVTGRTTLVPDVGPRRKPFFATVAKGRLVEVRPAP